MHPLCPSCGASLSISNARFCPACAQPLVQVSGMVQAMAMQGMPRVVVIEPEKPSALAVASSWLGAFSLFFLPASILAIPLGLVSISAIAQGKHPRAGLWPSVRGVLLGMWGYFLLALVLKFFSAIHGAFQG